MKRKLIKKIIFFSFLNKEGTVIETQTVGNPQYFKTFKLSDGSLVNVKLFDTSGQEQYRSLTENYYKKADCCLLVYDISNKKSFLELKNYYIGKMKEKCKKNIKVILLGNKTDLEGEGKREVKSKEGADLAEKNDYIFMETSCLKNTNVADAFETLIEDTNIEAKKHGNNNNNFELKENSKKEKFCYF